VQLSDIGDRKDLRLWRKADLKARFRRLENAQDKPVLARPEARYRTRSRNRLGAGMHGPHDRGRDFRGDLVLNHHLPADQRRSAPNGARRPAVGGR
jgi:hypothetical protein